MIAALAGSATAGATADVSLGIDGRLGIAVPAVDGPDGNHGVIVEPFRDSFRNLAFRVRQLDLGDAPFSSSDGDCLVNPAVNDVVCGGPRASGALTMGDARDRVVLLEREFDDTLGAEPFLVTVVIGPFVFTFPLQPGATAGSACIVTRNVGPVTVDLGAGDDGLMVVEDTQCTTGTFPERGFLARLTANGGAGNDGIQGGPANETLGGGPGNDIIDGGPGNDAISSSTGTDDLRGGDGDDTFCCSSSGSATIAGGAGTDTVTYSPTTAAVAVTIGDDSNGDGLVGFTNDKVQASVEDVVSGSGNDSLVGSGKANVLRGNVGNDVLRGEGGGDRLEGAAGRDTLSGGDGTDTLVGGDGDDVLIGGAGADDFDGGPGNDTLDARDGSADGRFSCGPGTDDLTLDLREPLPSLFAGCETVSRFAVDDGPPGVITSRVLRLGRDGSARATLACPRRARVTCRGTLSVLRPRGRARVLGSAAYAVRRGTRAVLSVPLNASPPPAGSRVLLRAIERGASSLGPRSSQRTLVLRPV